MTPQELPICNAKKERTKKPLPQGSHLHAVQNSFS